MKFLKSISDYITDKDDVYTPGSLSLHFDQDKKLKTLLGGIITIFVQMCVMYIAIKKTFIMFSYDEPDLLTLERSIEGELDEN